jgi:hypothetical protein
MSTSESKGAAFDATVETAELADAESARGRSPEQQQYFDEVAADAERVVARVEETIADLQASLADRRAEAVRARKEADNGKDQS